MKTTLSATLLLLFVSFAVGCGNATLDGASQPEFDASLQAMMDGLDSDEERSRLKGALLVIEGRYRLRSSLGLPQEGSANTFLEAVDGKTYEEILELAQTSTQ